MAWRYTYCYFKKRISFVIVSVFFFSSSIAQSIFQPGDVPAVPRQNDNQPIEVGVKFRSSQADYITGIRYYKGAGTTGAHTGQLWSTNGTLLASANFENETAFGWQQVLFSGPVSINANTTYVAACFSASGDYAFTNSYFNTAVVNGPLRALANGEDGPNGVFIFSSIPVLPTNTFQSSNYWVDVVFKTDIGPDTYPPTITSVTPYDGAIDISLSTEVKAGFNEPMNASSINSSTVELRNSSGTLVAATITYTSSSNTVIVTPSSSLTSSSAYTVKIKGGSAGVKDVAGNSLVNDYTWTFTTVDPPFLPPTEGYGGPILVISDPANPFSRYTTEILRAEGLNEFAAKDIAAVTTADLANYDIVILGEMPVTSQQTAMLGDWVNAGGTLIAFKPAASLHSLLGISAANTTLSNKYLLVNTSPGPGAGIVNQTMQYHGEASLYTLNGASAIATLYSNATAATTNPAITTMNVGSNGGRAIAFAYDLAKSIVYTRQGNPAWAGQKRDGQAGPIRSDDLFYPDWIDFNKVAIPQADEQQRLLANIILQSNLHRKPLPRLWYLPKKLKAAIVMTGDDHANNGTAGRFNHYLTLGPNTTQDVANWNAVRGTSYIYPNTPISNAQAAALEAQGFEIAMHPTTQCLNFTAASLENSIAAQAADFKSRFPSLSSPATNRTHCMPWSDWSTHPQVESNHAMRMDMNYYYWPDAWIQNRPGMFTGSGMPMRFAGLNGSLIDCYQATTQMTDESGIDIAGFSDFLLSKATGAEGYYGTFVANMHTDSANHNGSDAVIASAKKYGIPVIAARQLLRWIDGRNNTSFSNMTWNNDQLSFTVTAPSGARNLSLMLPLHSENNELVSVTANGNDIAFTTEEIKGFKYAFVNVAIGTTSIVANYNAGIIVTVNPSPQITCEGSTVSFTSTATGNPSPTVQWQMGSSSNDWTNIAGADNPTLSFNVTLNDNNKQYRAVWSNGFNSVNSNIASLTVNANPVLTSTTAPPPVTSGTPFSYTPASSIAGTSFSWQRDAAPGISNPAANGTGNINETLINTTGVTVKATYVYTLTANNCISTYRVVVKVEPPLPGCSMSTSITANFNNTSIPAGRYIWFNSVVKPFNVSNRVTNITISNSKITYSLNNQLVTLNVPGGQIKFDPAVSAATTNYVNGVWATTVPANYNGNVFMTGLSYKVLSGLPGGIKNVKWSMDVAIDRDDVSLEWKWTAGVYTNFADNAGLNVKPTDGLLSILNPLLGVANAGTPVNYSLNIAAGAMGAGLLNITNTYSSTSLLSCLSANSMVLSGKSGARSSLLPGLTLATENLKAGVQPNPSYDYFTISINGSINNPVSIRVTDISGRVVEKRDKLSTGTLQMGHSWNSGTYFAEINSAGQRKIIKLIKAN